GHRPADRGRQGRRPGRPPGRGADRVQPRDLGRAGAGRVHGEGRGRRGRVGGRPQRLDLGHLCRHLPGLGTRGPPRWRGRGTPAGRRGGGGPRARVHADRRLVVHVPGARVLRAARFRGDRPDRGAADRGSGRRPPRQAAEL
ncbi:MAG: hypothetical protein AVDCRST_MAG57-3408, partial [uncultured Blastococcus sp.]